MIPLAKSTFSVTVFLFHKHNSFLSDYALVKEKISLEHRLNFTWLQNVYSNLNIYKKNFKTLTK